MQKALIVDDHPFIRSSVSLLLQGERFEVAQTDNGIDAVRLARDLQPDLLILDISMPGLDGLEVMRRIRAMGLQVKILILTSQLAEYFSIRCMRAGAIGFVSKTDDLSELGKAVQAVMSGYSYFPEVALSSVRKVDFCLSEAECIARLTDREVLILQQLARGLSNKAIGEAMLLSNKTVSTYKTRLIEKLRVSSLVDLADVAKRNQLI
ncbi:response regulator transcription factor [Pseudomonas rubra]|uniref:Response regulator transcription factor n=1 Tax=Pseudomonas rubra TaxID=2942627 RepID=A0ABT5PBU4_9PSED|nr:response regulator transcription factor [Pseudomonas rubra]MDD1015647.1 response regulator transcription factor [Pseudomonas rubra]MDD1040269.1 response regulator transcription factor [Pseudomonas rubra]MDD1153860.1 response regulator transcription factor [Pseudomonas rubra]